MPVCTGGAEALRRVNFPAAGLLGLHSNSRSILTDPVHGTVSPTATMQFQGRSGVALNVVVNIMGRVRACAACEGLPGYTKC